MPVTRKRLHAWALVVLSAALIGLWGCKEEISTGDTVDGDGQTLDGDDFTTDGDFLPDGDESKPDGDTSATDGDVIPDGDTSPDGDTDEDNGGEGDGDESGGDEPFPEVRYAVVGTAQSVCYDLQGVANCPAEGQPFAGQDAQYSANARSPRYRDNDDGTVTDLPQLSIEEPEAGRTEKTWAWSKW